MYCTVYVGTDRALDSGLSGSNGTSLGATVRSFLSFAWIFHIRILRATIIASDKLNTLPTRSSLIGSIKRLNPPFIPAHDITRGVMFAAQTLLGYLFMLTVMYVVLLFSSFADVLMYRLWVGRTSSVSYSLLWWGLEWERLFLEGLVVSRMRFKLIMRVRFVRIEWLQSIVFLL
jgi:hypothetical protein